MKHCAVCNSDYDMDICPECRDILIQEINEERSRRRKKRRILSAVLCIPFGIIFLVRFIRWFVGFWSRKV